jgi:hypothetical protein
VEVRHDVVGVVIGPVHARLAEDDARHAAQREEEDEPDREQHRRLELIEPCHIVAIQEKIFTPVGTAMTMVATMK